MMTRLTYRFALTAFLGITALSAAAFNGKSDTLDRNTTASLVSTSSKKFSSSAVKSPKVLTSAAIFDSLHLNDIGLNKKVFTMAVRGMEKLRRMGKLSNNRILSIVDFSQPSIQKRMYVIDVENCTLLFNTLVAHGMKSGKEKAMSFSNKPSSNKSSLGFYVTNSTYMGSNGYSLRLQGCEKGFNDNAARRAIVVHGADYVNEDWIGMQGYIGRSQGCPALPPAISGEMIDEIKDGSCLFIYHPNPAYLKGSRLIK